MPHATYKLIPKKWIPMLRLFVLCALLGAVLSASEFSDKGYSFGENDMGISVYTKEDKGDMFFVAFENRTNKTLKVLLHVREKRNDDGTEFIVKPGNSYASQKLKGVSASYQVKIVSVKE